MDRTIESAQGEHNLLKASCEAGAASLSLPSDPLQTLTSLRVSTHETIEQFEARFDAINRRAQALDEKRAEATSDDSDTAKKLREIQHAGAVPNEKDLSTVRDERNQAWKLIRRQWLENEDISAEAKILDAERALPEAFEARMVDSDDLADRLRREADRVHAQASLLADQEEIAQRKEEIAGQLEQCATDKKRLDDEWEALWQACSIQPRTPREMRVWLESFEKLRDRIGDLNKQAQQIATLKKTRERHVSIIEEKIKSVGGVEASATESLEAVLLAAEEIAANNAEILRKRETLNDSINTLEADADSSRVEEQAARDALDEWQTSWEDSVKALGLSGEALPTEAADIIDKLKDLFAKRQDTKKLQIRIKAIDEEAETFRDQVAALMNRIAPELKELPADEAVNRLTSLLSDSQTRHTQREQARKQLTEADEEYREATNTINAMTKQLDGLCKEGRCDSPGELDTAECRSTEYKRLKDQLAIQEQSILDVGEGGTLDALERESQDVDPDELPAKIKKLTDRIDDEFDPQRVRLAEEKGGLNKELEQMDGNDNAAALADQDQWILAGIRSKSERYVRLKLAARILRDEIERYREANQGPLIKHAIEHFAALTLGSFVALRADFNDKDEPILVGIRANNERVQVGGMSEGTRDQLYLALRLASLERYMKSAGAMPFIVDDILVDFDDERSKAALSSLARLAEKTQVILFTHHSRVVEQAQRLQQERVQIHEL